MRRRFSIIRAVMTSTLRLDPSRHPSQRRRAAFRSQSSKAALARADYRLVDGVMRMVHTEVPAAVRRTWHRCEARARGARPRTRVRAQGSARVLLREVVHAAPPRDAFAASRRRLRLTALAARPIRSAMVAVRVRRLVRRPARASGKLFASKPTRYRAAGGAARYERDLQHSTRAFAGAEAQLSRVPARRGHRRRARRAGRVHVAHRDPRDVRPLRHHGIHHGIRSQGRHHRRHADDAVHRGGPVARACRGRGERRLAGDRGNRLATRTRAGSRRRAQRLDCPITIATAGCSRCASCTRSASPARAASPRSSACRGPASARATTARDAAA